VSALKTGGGFERGKKTGKPCCAVFQGKIAIIQVKGGQNMGTQGK